jgi:structural maintenance of chromosome 3 (chondroitin sulfate proteoglycan 6)
MDCITIEGDQINRKGALTGGYRDSKNNRLTLMNTMRLAEQRRTELEENLEKIKSEILQVETLLNRYILVLFYLVTLYLFFFY